MTRVHTSVVTISGDDVQVRPVGTHKYLFTTSTCPNCKMAKKMLAKGFDKQTVADLSGLPLEKVEKI